MNRTMLIAATLFGAGLTSLANAGDWNVTDEGEMVYIQFSGPVEDGDWEQLNDGLVQAAGRQVVLDIETPGGLAVEGIIMCDMITNYPGTIATRAVGSGAWSAGAMMWVGGDIQVIEPDSVVGFHLAYVPGCRTCDTAGINGIIGGVIGNAVTSRQSTAWPTARDLLIDMATVRDTYGPQGFVMFNAEGRKDIGMWWDFYPDASDLISEGDQHVGRTQPGIEARPVDPTDGA